MSASAGRGATTAFSLSETPGVQVNSSVMLWPGESGGDGGDGSGSAGGWMRDPPVSVPVRVTLTGAGRLPRLVTGTRTFTGRFCRTAVLGAGSTLTNPAARSVCGAMGTPSLGPPHVPDPSKTTSSVGLRALFSSSPTQPTKTLGQVMGPRPLGGSIVVTTLQLPGLKPVAVPTTISCGLSGAGAVMVRRRVVRNPAWNDEL